MFSLCFEWYGIAWACLISSLVQGEHDVLITAFRYISLQGREFALLDIHWLLKMFYYVQSPSLVLHHIFPWGAAQAWGGAVSLLFPIMILWRILPSPLLKNFHYVMLTKICLIFEIIIL